MLAMTASEIEQLVEQILVTLPERISGNEANQVIAERLAGLAVSSRNALVEYLRGLISFRVRESERIAADAVREAGIWMALDLTEALSLQELLPDIKNLIGDIRDGAVFKPVHESMVSRYLSRIESLG
jgi:hypothetical protein